MIWLAAWIILALLTLRVWWLATRPKGCICWECGNPITYYQVPPDRCRTCRDYL